MSQGRLAELLCDLSGRPTVTRSEISRYERGVRTPSTYWKRWLAVALNVPVTHLERTAASGSAILTGSGDDDSADQLASSTRRSILESPWTPPGTLTAIAATSQGGLMDRRRYLISAGADLANLATNWAGALDDPTRWSYASGRQLSEAVILSLEQRLDHLRHLDDAIGGSELYPLASAEYALMSKLADGADIDSPLGRRLLSALAEAARICGWLNYDAGRHASAQSFYVTALRASSTAGDAEAGAHILGRMADQVLNVGNPQDALNLMRTAQEQVAHRTTPRVRAMLHAFAGCALSRTGDRSQAAREFDAAREAMSAGVHDDDPAWIYWMTDAEVGMLAGSAAHDLGDYRLAVDHYATARQSYDAHTYVRDTALFLAREARAHLALGDVETACATATQALTFGGEISSARPSDTLSDFRAELIPHRNVMAARDFLELSAA